MSDQTGFLYTLRIVIFSFKMAVKRDKALETTTSTFPQLLHPLPHLDVSLPANTSLQQLLQQRGPGGASCCLLVYIMISTGLVWVWRTAAVTCCRNPLGIHHRAVTKPLPPDSVLWIQISAPTPCSSFPSLKIPSLPLPSDLGMGHLWGCCDPGKHGWGKHFEPDVGSALSELNLGFLMTILVFKCIPVIPALSLCLHMKLHSFNWVHRL